MMGLQAAPERLFYDFCLEDHIPVGHLLRQIDRFLDFGDILTKLAPYYCSIGRPSIDPELMIRMLVVGYCFAIRSERRLCEEVASEPVLSLVLRARAGRQGAGPFDLLAKPPWALRRAKSLTHYGHSQVFSRQLNLDACQRLKPPRMIGCVATYLAIRWRYLDMRFTTIVVAVLALTFSAVSPKAGDKHVNLGSWTATIPSAMEEGPLVANQLSYGQVLEPFHTLVFFVRFEKSYRWDQEPSLRQPGDVVGLHNLLAEVLEVRKRAMAKSIGWIKSASVSAMDRSLLPQNSICGGFKAAAKDVGVLTAREAFVLHGYSVICIDFVDGASVFDIIEVGFSERYCKKIGHKPLSDFDERARKVLRSIRYSKGPPHDTLLGAVPAPKEGLLALSGIGSMLETPTEIFLEPAACPS